MTYELTDIPLENILSPYIRQGKCQIVKIVMKDYQYYVRVVTGNLVELDEYRKMEEQQ